jgi:hypothetical protein
MWDHTVCRASSSLKSRSCGLNRIESQEASLRPMNPGWLPDTGRPREAVSHAEKRTCAHMSDDCESPAPDVRVIRNEPDVMPQQTGSCIGEHLS